MKYMIEFRLKPGHKQQVLDIFEKVGPNRSNGVVFRGAWIGSRSDIIYVLAESNNQERIAEVVNSWSDHGEATYHAVVDVDEV